MDRATRSSACRERLARSPRRTARSSSILHKLLQSQSKCRARRRRSASFLQGLQFSFPKPTNRRLVSPRTEAVTVGPIPKCLCLRGICHTVPRHSAWRPVNRPQTPQRGDVGADGRDAGRYQFRLLHKLASGCRGLPLPVVGQHPAGVRQSRGGQLSRR